jgi:hypothetical protein
MESQLDHDQEDAKGLEEREVGAVCYLGHGHC